MGALVLRPEEPAPLKPRRLVPGATVGVAALSGPVSPAALASGVAALETLGYRVVLAPNALSRGGPLGLAGSDDERLSGYETLVSDPSVSGIFLARGGYGMTRLLPRLPAELVRERRLLHCGFSDGTALSSFLLGRCGLGSFHGPMAAADLARPLDPLTARFFPSLLEGQGPPALEVPGADVLVGGTARGRLAGGCLSLLAALVGTPWETSLDGALLLLEDVAEEAYRIDRMLTALVQGGRLDRLAGVLIGSMTRITFGGAEDPARLRAVLLDRLSPLGVPVAMGLPFGHGVPNVPLPIGTAAEWDGETRTLRFVEDVVS